jgi:chromosome segregation ATPase
MTEADLARAEANTEKAEVKAKGLQEDMRALANKLKAMQVRVEKAGDLEEKYEKTINDLQARLKSTERHASDSESIVVKLQREVDHLRDELLQTKMQYQSLRQELDPYSREIRAN